MRILSLWMFIGAILFSSSLVRAQNWSIVDPQTIVFKGMREIIPQTYITYHMDDQVMKNILWSAPDEYLQNPNSSNTIITVGLADGCADLFRVVEYDMMEAPLAAEFPDIKTFRGVSISNPYRTIRIDWSKKGFRAVISDLDGKTFIDPFQRNDMANRIVYYKKNYVREIDWICGVQDPELHDGNIHEQRIIGDCEFRSYRLAVATTGEYSNFFGATSSAQSALVLSEVVTAVNRVNDVYEADFSTRLILIGNTTSVFYYDPGGDPFSGDACTQLGQNQTNMTNVIGGANYDVGHVFSVGSGGCAGLGVICSSNNKARGATGLNPPTGDPFYIDYVAHELGHQFGGNHTQNNSCNRNAATAMEPGSASTIMGYAGICPPDVQNNSDAYMHGISLQEIASVIGGTSCETIVSTTNTPPVVANVPNYTIPISTPFVLTASATDDENNPLTYCWEQWDQEVGAVMPPASTNVVGPMFRSLLPTSSPSRYFPNLPDLLAGINPTWEELPSVTRDMEFRVTVRDNNGLYGCTDEDNTVVSTSATSGPFIVTSQNAATTWLEGATVTITWNVANTTAAPVSCANVDIRLSLDGGLTYPTALSLNEPNDGTANVAVPPGTTTTGRVMVKGANNIFFDINNANITINPGLPNFTLALNPTNVSECNDGSVQTTVVVGQFMGFTDPVTLSTLNLPPGAIATFVPQVVIPGFTSTLTISNLSGLFGTYTPTVRGTTTTGIIKEAIFTIELLSPPASGPTLVSPANNSTDAVITPILDWQSLTGATQYDYQLAYDNSFSLIVLSGSVLTDQLHITSPLVVGQQYFWRVRAINTCGTGAWSSAFNFTTVSCFSLFSSDVPVTIPAAGSNIVTSTFNSVIDMVINDVNVINLTGVHSWVDDLKFSLIAPDATERLIWNRPCNNEDDFNINFDDEAAPGTWPCPPTNGLTYRPSNTLSVFDGKNSGGIWTLEIEDIADQDGGTLYGWGLKVCGDLTCQLVVTQISGAGPGSLAAALNCADPGDTVRLSSLLSGLTINVGAAPLVLAQDVVILAEGANITITGGGGRIFEISNVADVEFLGMKIIAGTSLTAGAINNPGVLRLKNVIIERNAAAPGATLIQNSAGAQFYVNGNCYIEQ